MARWEQLIRTIHSSGQQLVLSATGGGSAAIARLLQVPGGSQSVLEAVVPYSATAVDQWLTRKPDSYCSRETALVMASVAWKRAAELTGKRMGLIGVGCTASLVSDRPKRGLHRGWVATQSDKETRLLQLRLTKGARTREDEDNVIADLVLGALAESIGLRDIPLPNLTGDESIDEEFVQPHELIQHVWRGDQPVVWSHPDGSLSPEVDVAPKGLISGAFNPLHRGHLKLREVAEEMLGGLVYFELTIANADKPKLDYLSIEQRRKQFQTCPLALSTASLFVDKARCFPHTTFVIGYDTAERLLSPRFYGNTTAGTELALQGVREHGCKFLVAGRVIEGTFHSLEQLDVPEFARDMFSSIPENRFRDDISSTVLRAKSSES